MLEIQRCLLSRQAQPRASGRGPRAVRRRAFAIDVETDHRHARSRKGNRDRQADIAEADDGDLSLMLQSRLSLPRACLAGSRPCANGFRPMICGRADGHKVQRYPRRSASRSIRFRPSVAQPLRIRVANPYRLQAARRPRQAPRRRPEAQGSR